MTQKYRVPFNIDLEDLIAEDEGLTEEELLGAIKNEFPMYCCIEQTQTYWIRMHQDKFSVFFGTFCALKLRVYGVFEGPGGFEKMLR